MLILLLIEEFGDLDDRGGDDEDSFTGGKGIWNCGVLGACW